MNKPKGFQLRFGDKLGLSQHLDEDRGTRQELVMNALREQLIHNLHRERERERERESGSSDRRERRGRVEKEHQPYSC
jgi:hypothetical protein